MKLTGGIWTGEESRLSLERVVKELGERFRGSLLRDYPLSRLTTFRVGGPAALVAMPIDEGDIQIVLEKTSEHNLPLLVMGKGSNLLCSDRGFPGVVLLMRKRGKPHIDENGQLEVEAAIPLNTVIAHCVARGRGGLEELVGIPGTVGGAIWMNAGANQKDISQCLVEIYICEPEKGMSWSWRPKSDFPFSYRYSGIGNRLIYKAILKTYSCDVEELRNLCHNYQEKRKATQPLSRPSAGSVFKNGENYQAGELIERCGCKGWRVGDALVSRKHANFIVNMGKASAREILELIEMVRAKVYEMERVQLELEIELVGF